LPAPPPPPPPPETIITITFPGSPVIPFVVVVYVLCNVYPPGTEGIGKGEYGRGDGTDGVGNIDKPITLSPLR
jgi:hypothetical protein